MSRIKTRYIRCDAVLTYPQSYLHGTGEVVGGPTITTQCSAIHEVVGSLDWVIIEHRARSRGWKITGPSKEREHLCPTHAQRGDRTDASYTPGSA